MKRYPPFKVGDVINDSVVIQDLGYNKHHQRHYEIECICGTKHICTSYNLRRKKNQKCKVCSRNNPLSPIKDLYDSYKHDSKRRSRNYEFLLTFDQFKELVKLPCFYCGIEPIQEIKNKYFSSNYNGLDRINNDIGYLFNNVVPCCKSCNTAKHAMSFEDFLQWVNRVYKHIQKQSTAVLVQHSAA